MKKSTDWTLITATLVAMSSSGCGLGQGPTVRSGLEGTWRWVESSGGIAGVTRTPESTGIAMTLTFDAFGVVGLRRDGAPERETAYEAVRVDHPGRPVWEIHYRNPLFGFDVQTVELPTPDELVLVDPCCDGFVWRFERFR